MLVMKFGGSSLANAERIKNVGEIIKKNINHKPVIVVSAVGGVTDLLIELSKEAIIGKKQKILLNDILHKHYEIINLLKINKNIIDKEVKLLSDLTYGVSLLKEMNQGIADNFVSFGERFSARIVASYLKSLGINSEAKDAFDIGIIINKESKFEVSKDKYHEIKEHISKTNHVLVITGFIAKDTKGKITTLGRGGSDYTATIIGAAINAEEVQIWTDVDGIMTADPKLVKNPKKLDSVSFEEASEIAFLGAKVLHPKTILPAIEKNIPVRILNTFNPKNLGTVVSNNIIKEPRVSSITYKKSIKVINISTPRMLESKGFLRRIFEVFDINNISVDMVSTSEINISVTIDNLKNQRIDKAESELKEIGKVDIKENRAIISVVGNKMIHVPNVMGIIFSALNNIDVEMISSSMSEINQSFVIKEEQLEEAVKRLHKAFFGV